MHESRYPLSLALLIAGVALFFAGEARAGRPPPLPGEEGCELWRGGASGNDPTVLVEVSLCGAGDGRITGRLQWSSLRSGWNLRRIEGRWSTDGRRQLSLRDVEILEERPEPGWMFCVIDRYDLTPVRPGRLEGSYVSRRCDDHASIWLERQESPPVTDAGPETPRPTPTTNEPLGDTPTAEPGPSQIPVPSPREQQGCRGCAATSEAPRRGGWMLIAILLGMFVARLSGIAHAR